MILLLIKSLYTNTRNYVRTKHAHSEEFTTHDGLRQGGVLSPLLFIILVDDNMKMTRPKVTKLHVGHRNLERVTITECAFADDIVIFAPNEEDLKRNLEIWKKTT